MQKARLFVATALLLLTSACGNAGDVCSIVKNPRAFNRQNVTLEGTVTALKETTSPKGNDYTTFKLEDPSGCGTVKIFTWGHPTISDSDQVRVEGVFETEHINPPYIFYNEVQAEKIVPVSHSDDMGTMDKKAISKACSDQANAKGLHGEERKKFRAQCKHKGGKISSLPHPGYALSDAASRRTLLPGAIDEDRLFQMIGASCSLVFQHRSSQVSRHVA